VLVAAAMQLSSLDLPQAMLVSGQALNVLQVLAAAGLATYLWRRPLAGIVAALVVGLLSIFPAYYVSWGRYTQLTGLLLLPPLMIVWLELLKANDRRSVTIQIGSTGAQTNADERGQQVDIRVRPRSSASNHGAGDLAHSPDLSPGECAALLIACAFYRRHAPVDAPLLPHTGLEARLRADLTPQLQSAVDTALAALRPPPMESRRMAGPATATPAVPAPLERTITTLRAAVAHQHPLELTYDTAGQGALSTRTVQPLALEQRDDTWYLRAYCSARQAERTFRVDRIMAIADCRS
jgi:hypothetical protein